jgi:hypothetical protein
MKLLLPEYFIQGLKLLLLFTIVHIVDLVYYMDQPLSTSRPYLMPALIVVCTLEFFVNLTKHWNILVKCMVPFIIFYQIQHLIELDRLLERKRFLYQTHVIDFSYDKYCNLSGDDKMLIEEISVFGYTDCDDAKIPYLKLDLTPNR